MTITITNEEFDAICFAIDQIENEIECASEESYIDDATHRKSALNRIVEKYRNARYKANEFQDVRRIVAEKNKGRCLMPRDIDKLARKYYRYLKQNKIL